MWVFILANPWRAGCIVLLGLMLGLYVQGAHYKASAEKARRELAQAVTNWTKAERDAVQAARQAENAQREALAKLDAQHQKELEEAKNAQARTIAELRNGTLRLQKHWAGCETDRLSSAAASAAELDESARLRAESAGRIIGAADECDAQVRGLQGAVKAQQRTER